MSKIIDGIRDYFLECPLLENNRINVYYLGLEPIEFSIEILPTEPIIHRYVDGGAKMQYDFAFTSRNDYSSDVIDNIQNSSFYENLEEWIDNNNKKEIYPNMPSKCSAFNLQVVSSGYLFDSDTTTAKYQIQLKLLYTKEN